MVSLKFTMLDITCTKIARIGKLQFTYNNDMN